MTRLTYSFTGFSCLAAFFIILSSCNSRKGSVSRHVFTKTDSITEQYLMFQDSMLQSWNSMLNDDNLKIRRMKGLLEQLKTLNLHNPETLSLFDQRLAKLETIRYDEQNRIRIEVVEEYDSITNSLIVDLTALVDAANASDKRELQKSIDEIKSADQRVAVHRNSYDQIVAAYNQFIDLNKTYIDSGERDITLEKKTGFQLALDENGLN